MNGHFDSHKPNRNILFYTIEMYQNQQCNKYCIYIIVTFWIAVWGIYGNQNWILDCLIFVFVSNARLRVSSFLLSLFSILLLQVSTIFYNVFLDPFISFKKTIHICIPFPQFISTLGMKMGVKIARGKIHCMSATYFMHVLCHLLLPLLNIFLCVVFAQYVCFFWGKMDCIHSEIGQNT